MLIADLALARRVESAWAASTVACAEAHARRHPGAGVAIEAVGGGNAVFFGAGSPVSQAQGLGLNGPVDPADLDRVEAFFAARDAPTPIEVCTLADPSLWALLGQRGYRPSEPSHMLVRPIVPGGPSPETRGPVQVELIGPEPETAALWAQTVIGSFFEGSESPPAGLYESLLDSVEIPSASCWLARIGDEPAGGATLFVIDGAAMFAGDGVLPAYRGQGVQTALLRARLAHAGRLGADLAVICTQPGSASQRNAERLGFHVAYARFLFVRD